MLIRAHGLIMNNNIRRVILEIETIDVKSLKIVRVGISFSFWLVALQKKI